MTMSQRMNKRVKILVTSCAILSVSCLKTGTAFAALNLETDASVAGVSVAFNNYYASSLNPEDELAKVFSSEGILNAAVKNDVPEVKAPQKSAYDNVAIARVQNSVNVRTQANTSSKVVGKIYNNCAATILDTVEGEGGSWYHIQSGTVKGYIKAQYFITGAEAESMAKKVGKIFAKVSSSSSLRLRESPSLDSRTLEMLSPAAEYEVIGEEGDFVKIAVDTDLVGYVFKDYVNIQVEFDHAVSIAEEQAKQAEEARRKKEAKEALDKLEEARKEEAGKETQKETQKETKKETKPAKTTAAATVPAPPGAVKPKETTSKAPAAPGMNDAPGNGPENGPGGGPGYGPGGGPGSGNTGSSNVTSATRSAIVAYAKQFLGNPYVYGGTSLTNGADCSGFTQAIFSHFGIQTGRSSRDQAAKGREIAVSSAQPGDLLFYASGNYINHVALYIGGGQVIHASNPNTGITISPSNYRTPCKAVTFLK